MTPGTSQKVKAAKAAITGSILSQGVTLIHAGGTLGADGDEATAAAMRALRDEAKVLQAEKAAKKAAFDAEYDVGGLLGSTKPLLYTALLCPCVTECVSPACFVDHSILLLPEHCSIS